MKRGPPKDSEPTKEMRDHSGLVDDAPSHPLRVRILGWIRHRPARTQSEARRRRSVRSTHPT